MGGSTGNIIKQVGLAALTGGTSLLFTTGTGQKLLGLGGDESGESIATTEPAPHPPMTEDAIAEAEKKIAGTQRKKKGMASTIFTSVSGAPLGGSNVSNIFAQGA